MEQGMIVRGIEPAEQLYKLVQRPDISTIVETGGFRGMGSTKCIIDGILDSGKKNYEVFSIEIDESYHEDAKINLIPLPPNVHLIKGSIITGDELNYMRNNLDSRNGPGDITSKVASVWLERNILQIKEAKNVFNLLPNQIDLLVIDGGEFAGEVEFSLLKDRSTYFYLDDISSWKNKKNANYVLSNPDKFEIIYKTDQTLICKKHV